MFIGAALRVVTCGGRIAQWPSATPLHQKLGLEDLKKTTDFITAAGLVV